MKTVSKQALVPRDFQTSNVNQKIKEKISTKNIRKLLLKTVSSFQGTSKLPILTKKKNGTNWIKSTFVPRARKENWFVVDWWGVGEDWRWGYDFSWKVKGIRDEVVYSNHYWEKKIGSTSSQLFPVSMRNKRHNNQRMRHHNSTFSFVFLSSYPNNHSNTFTNQACSLQHSMFQQDMIFWGCSHNLVQNLSNHHRKENLKTTRFILFFQKRHSPTLFTGGDSVPDEEPFIGLFFWSFLPKWEKSHGGAINPTYLLPLSQIIIHGK